MIFKKIEGERRFEFTDSMPMQRGAGGEKRLVTTDPGRWIFKNSFSAVTLVVLFAFLFIFLFVIALLAGKNGILPLVILGVSLVGLIIFLTKHFSRTPVFDFENNCYYLGKKRPEYGDYTSLKDYLPLSQITGVQFLYKIVRGSKGHTRQYYEINLFTQELTRVFVVDGCNKEQLFKEAQMLAERLNVPLKENDENRIEKKRMPLFVRCLFGIIFGGCGALLMTMTAIVPLSQHLKSESWIQTPAVVISSHVSQERRKSKNGSYTVYIPEIRYNYQYNKKSYSSLRHNFFKKEYRNPREAQELVRQHYPGKKITCFVDPDKPSEAVISRQIDHWDLGRNFLFSGLFLAVGLFIAFNRRL